ncbi:hypothetical protein [Dokdonella soli]|uniref:Transporter n=1 Tax=Dokdonella soli TaxID=529810 RepID=A0ABP3TMU2_9GAMM
MKPAGTAARPLLLAALLAPSFASACSSCGCTLNSDWASQGYSVGAGLRFDLRYDYFNQSQLRSGTDSVDRASLELPNEREIQQTTVNRNTTLSVDYAPSRAWGVNVQLPYFDRYHSTIAPGDTALSYSQSSGMGDARITARYQGFSPEAGFGVLFGVKLPTGRTGTNFYAGPQAGTPLDRGLQLGTGTWDALLGVYDFGSLGPSVGYFAQAVLQQPLNSDSGFRPGTGVNVTAGLRYTAWSRITPQFQFNLRAEKRESGVNADVANSGATLAYLSPGIGFRLNAHWDGFAFIQLPVYQRVNGFQLEPERLFSVGLQYRM